jgi:hypothetical protein
MGELIQMIPKTELTPEQREHWWRQLESAERQVEYAKRMLGLIAIERGIGETPENS